MKKLFVSCAVSALVPALLSAAVVAFRSGAVLRAELSEERPSGFRSFTVASKPENPVYAAVTVKLDRGRSISVFDYSLKAGGAVYRCAAVRDNSSGRFVESSDGGDKRRCTLFFELDASRVSGRSGKNLRLVCNVPGVGETKLLFADRGDRGFTPDSKIPESGSATPGK